MEDLQKAMGQMQSENSNDGGSSVEEVPSVDEAPSIEEVD